MRQRSGNCRYGTTLRECKGGNRREENGIHESCFRHFHNRHYYYSLRGLSRSASCRVATRRKAYSEGPLQSAGAPFYFARPEEEERNMQRTIGVVTEDGRGVLSRISGLMDRRGFQVKGVTAGETQRPGHSRFTLVIGGTTGRQVRRCGRYEKW